MLYLLIFRVSKNMMYIYFYDLAFYSGAGQFTIKGKTTKNIIIGRNCGRTFQLCHIIIYQFTFQIIFYLLLTLKIDRHMGP